MQPLAFISRHPEISESLVFIMVGFALVLFVLFLLQAATTFIGAFFQKAHKRAEKVAVSAAEKEDEELRTFAAAAAIATVVCPPPSFHSKIDPKHLAIIAAVARTTFDEEPRRIVSIRTRSVDWGLEGRVQLLRTRRPR